MKLYKLVRTRTIRLHRSSSADLSSLHSLEKILLPFGRTPCIRGNEIECDESGSNWYLSKKEKRKCKDLSLMSFH